MKKNRNTTKKLVEASIMVAFATVLSMLKIADMPYGGSVTAASMLPIIIVAYRHGLGMGLASGAVFATVQQLLGLNTLSYVTGWKSVVAVILLDYIIAFTLIGFGGLFKGAFKKTISSAPRRQGVELVIGTVFVCVLRYICHTVAGATVWAGLSIPTEAALIYSLGYNATYMLPETIVSSLAAGFIGSVIDLSRETPERFIPNAPQNEKSAGACGLLPYVIALVTLFTVAFDTVMIAPHLQNEITGEFDFSGIAGAPWVAIAIVSAIGFAAAAALFVARRIMGRK